MKPTELAITLATLPGNYYSADGWVSADEVRTRLKLLGFDATAQQTAAWLRRMALAESPWVECRPQPWGIREYRVTQCGANDVDNRLPGLTLCLPWLDRRGAASGAAVAGVPGGDGPTMRAMLDEIPAYNCLRHGLRAICTAGDGAPFTDAYRDAGGGYEGLQAIATAALAMADQLAAADGAPRA